MRVRYITGLFHTGVPQSQWLGKHEDRGQYHNIIAELYKEDRHTFNKFMLMSPETFTAVESRLTPDLQRQTNFLREPFSPGVKLAVTSRYLTTGESYVSLQLQIRVGSTINRFVPEICNAVIRYYCDEVVTCPTCPED